jgi:hypothetical protein
MAAFLPYIAATLIFDALHFHPFAPEHGPRCPHHLTEQASPLHATNNYECPTCNWQRNLPTQSARTWSPDVVRTMLPSVAPAVVIVRADQHVQPASFRGPPVVS